LGRAPLPPKPLPLEPVWPGAPGAQVVAPTPYAATVYALGPPAILNKIRPAVAQPNPLPPLETLRSTLSYNPRTGALTWLVDSPRRSAGTPAGYLAPNGYIQVRLVGRLLKAHRIAWALHHGADPGPLLVDHKNRNRSDNRASNLRLVDAKGNQANRAGVRRSRRGLPTGIGPRAGAQYHRTRRPWEGESRPEPGAP